MSILEKVRDFFYDDEEDVIEDIKKKPSKHHVKEKPIKIKKEEIIEEEKKETQSISERELFKAERTFNFPFDVDDEIVEKEVEVKEEPKKEEIRKEYKPQREFKETKPLSIRNYTKYEKDEEQDKKFKPTPVISPIYGILDKNYKKEDLLISDNNKVETEKKIDYETVRKRAYSNAYNNEEEKDSKGIFFNLDEEKKEDEDEVKIIYNDVEEEKEDDKNKTIGEKIEEYEKSLENKQDDFDETDNNEEENILSETKEQDLFNLIDNMYNSDEDDDDEEE